MTFDDITPVDFNAPQRSRTVERDRYMLKNKLEDHLAAGKAARPFWTAAAGLIPFGLGTLVTGGADALTDANIARQNENLNTYSAALGDDQTYNYSRAQSIDLTGLGQGIGGAIGIPQSFSDLKKTEVPQEQGFGGGTTGLYDGSNVNAPAMTDGAETINTGSSDYWGGLWNTGGGVTGIRSYETPPTTMEHGGTIKGASHERGGVDVFMNGSDTGIDVEGGEKVINKQDWFDVMGLLDKGNAAKAKELLHEIAEREPREMATGGTIALGGDQNIWDWGANNNAYTNAPVITETVDEIPYGLNNEIVATQLQYSDENPAPVSDIVSKQNAMAKYPWQNTFDNVYDFARFGAGMTGASTNLPEWRIPVEWGDYMDKRKYFSEQGILPEERAIMNTRNDAQYAAQVRDLANYSGGDAGAFLGNIAVANRDRYNANANVALADRKIRNEALNDYGGVLGQDIAYKRDAFDIGYNEDMLTKQAGAKLAQDAMSNIRERKYFNDAYGADSMYQKAFDSLIQQGVSADVAAATLKANPQLNMPSTFYGMNLPTVETPNYNLTR